MKGVLIALFIYTFLSSVWADDCPNAIRLFNHATLTSDLASKERIFKEAKAICSDPEVVSMILNNLGDTYEQTGRLSLAFDHYRKALKIKPDFALAYFSVGDIFFKLRVYYSAAVLYEKGLRYMPEDQESQNHRKEAMLRVKESVIVYFDFGSSVISERYVERLRMICEEKKEQGIDGLREIKVSGHTSDIGSAAYNEKLSLRRAEQVVRYLKEALSLDVLVWNVSAKGENLPLFSGADRNASILNRRVEVLVLKKEK